MYLPRHLGNALQDALRLFPAVFLSGPRQSGKTTFLQHELGQSAGYVTFDDPLEREFARNDPEGLLDRFPEQPVILDEVQYVPELLSHIKMRIDRERSRNGRWLLTGSQRFQLMSSISESLAGRVAILELLPFSVRELAAHLPLLPESIWNGFYPEPCLEPRKRDLWTRSYIQTYVERDVRQIKNIQDLQAFESFVTLVAARHAQELNVAALASTVGLSQPTIKSWIGVLEAAYVTVTLAPFFENFGKRIIKSPKLYLVDPALVCSLTRQPSADAALAGAMGGALFEGLVVLEVYKLLANLGRKPELYFWRSHDGLEVDLLIPVGGKLLPVEIKLTATPSAGHIESIERFKRIAQGKCTKEGVLVCRVARDRALPGGNTAIAWQRFPAWLYERLTTTS